MSSGKNEDCYNFRLVDLNQSSEGSRVSLNQFLGSILVDSSGWRKVGSLIMGASFLALRQ